MVIRNAIIYLGSAVAAKALPFFLLPFVTRTIAPDQVGTASLFMLYWAITNAVVGGNGHAYLSRRYYHVDKEEVGGIISNIFVANTILALGLLVVLAGAELLSPGLLAPFNTLLLFLPLGALMQVGVTMATTLARFEQRPFKFMFYELFMAAITTAVTITYILYVQRDWAYQFWATGLGVASVFGLSLLVERRYRFRQVRRKEVISVIRFCIPQTFHLFSGIALSVGDRFFIRHLRPNEELGIYAATYMLSSTFMVLVDAYVRSYSPSLFLAIKEEGVETGTGQKLFFRSAAALFFLALAASTVIWFAFGTIFPEEYASGRVLVPLFVSGFFFFSIYKLIFPFIISMDLQNRLVVSLVSIAAMSLALDYFLLERWGLIVAGIMTAVSYFALAMFSVLVFVFGRRQSVGTDL